MAVLTLQEALKELPDYVSTIIGQCARLSQGGGSQFVVSTDIGDLWTNLSQFDEVSNVVKGALAYVLKETKLPDLDPRTQKPLRLWQRTSIVYDAHGIAIPPSPTWEGYCERHLGKPVSTISNLYRNFQVYAHKLGWSVEAMLQAGSSRMKVARRLVEKLHPNVPPLLVSQIRGSVTVDELAILVRQQLGQTNITPWEWVGEVKSYSRTGIVEVHAEIQHGTDVYHFPLWELDVSAYDDITTRKLISVLKRRLES